jgi:hypothetical protein
MNEIVKIEQPTSMGLVPGNMTEAMQLANLMATAKLVPAALQKSPADCLLVIQQAVRWAMDPFMVAQECSVIQGKLMHSGKLVAAVVNSRGGLTQRLSFRYFGSDDMRGIEVSGQLRGEPEPRSVIVTLKEARTQNKVWQTQPDQQLMYHGTRVWARRHTPELMLGVWSPEEFDDGPAKERRAPTPAPLKLAVPRDTHKPLADAQLQHDPEMGEVREIDEPHPSDPDASAAPQGFDFGAAGETTTDRIARLDDALAIAAAKGSKALKDAWAEVEAADKPLMKAALDRRHKPAAAEADKATTG